MLASASRARAWGVGSAYHAMRQSACTSRNPDSALLQDEERVWWESYSIARLCYVNLSGAPAVLGGVLLGSEMSELKSGDVEGLEKLQMCSTTSPRTDS